MFDGKGLVPVHVMEDIAKAIRSKMKEQNLYKPTEMAAAIRSMTPYFYDTTGTFYILSPDYWTIHVNQSEHQTISYSASGEAVMKGVDKWSSRLFINSRIVANEGFTPGTIHKTIDSTNHDIVLMAEPATPIADMVKDGVILAYMKHDSNTLYSKMYMKRDETTKKDVLTFEDPIDVSNVDIPIRIVGSDSPDFTSTICPIQSQADYKNVKGFDSNYILTWKPYSLYGSFLGDNIIGSAGWKMEYFRMPNLTHFESRSELIRNIKSLKSVNFENLEFINSELYASEKRIIQVCTGCTSLTDVNFTQLKVAYCDLLTGCAAERLGFPNLEIVQSLTGFPNLVDISLPSLTSVPGKLLSDCPKLTNVKLPMLEKVDGAFLSNTPLIEEVDCPKVYELGDNLFTINRQNLKTINFPELVTEKGGLVTKQSSPNFTKVSFPKLQTVGGDAITGDSTLQTVETPELQSVGGKFVCNCNALTKVSFPKLQTVGGDSITEDSTLQAVEMPELQSVGGGFVNKCDLLTNVSFPKLQTIGGDAIVKDSTLQTVEMPELQSVGGELVDECDSLTKVSFPKLQTVGAFVDSSKAITNISAPKLQSASTVLYSYRKDMTLEPIDLPLLKSVRRHFGFQEYCKISVKSVNLPSLETVGGYFLCIETQQQILSFPNLKTVGNDLIGRISQPNLSEIELPNLESVGGICICNQQSPTLKKMAFPKLKTVGGDFAERSPYLENVEIPLLETVGQAVCCHEPRMKKFLAPSLKTVNGRILDDMAGLTFADFGALTKVGEGFITSSPSIKTVIIRSAVVPTIGGSICNSKPSDCTLYVPDDMIEKYLANSKWSAAFDKDHIKPISEAPQPPA